MTTKLHQVAARVASAEWLTARHPPMTPEQQALADEWDQAWAKALEECLRTGSAVTVVAPASKLPPQP